MIDPEVKKRLIQEWADLIASRSIKSSDDAMIMAEKHVADLELILFTRAMLCYG